MGTLGNGKLAVCKVVMLVWKIRCLIIMFLFLFSTGKTCSKIDLMADNVRVRVLLSSLHQHSMQNLG